MKVRSLLCCNTSIQAHTLNYQMSLVEHNKLHDTLLLASSNTNDIHKEDLTVKSKDGASVLTIRIEVREHCLSITNVQMHIEDGAIDTLQHVLQTLKSVCRSKNRTAHVVVVNEDMEPLLYNEDYYPTPDGISYVWKPISWDSWTVDISSIYEKDEQVTKSIADMDLSQDKCVASLVNIWKEAIPGMQVFASDAKWFIPVTDLTKIAEAIGVTKRKLEKFRQDRACFAMSTMFARKYHCYVIQGLAITPSLGRIPLDHACLCTIKDGKLFTFDLVRREPLIMYGVIIRPDFKKKLTNICKDTHAGYSVIDGMNYLKQEQCNGDERLDQLLDRLHKDEDTKPEPSVDDGDIVLLDGDPHQVVGDIIYSVEDQEPRKILTLNDIYDYEYDYKEVKSLCSIKPSIGKGDGLFMNVNMDKDKVIMVEPMIFSMNQSIPDSILKELREKFKDGTVGISPEWFLVFKWMDDNECIPFLDILVEDTLLYEKALNIEFNQIMVNEILPKALNNDNFMLEEVLITYRKIIANHYGSGLNDSSVSLMACKVNSGDQNIRIAGITTDLEKVRRYYELDMKERRNVKLDYFGVSEINEPVHMRVLIAERDIKKGEELCITYGDSHVV